MTNTGTRNSVRPNQMTATNAHTTEGTVRNTKSGPERYSPSAGRAPIAIPQTVASANESENPTATRPTVAPNCARGSNRVPPERTTRTLLARVPRPGNR